MHPKSHSLAYRMEKRPDTEGLERLPRIYDVAIIEQMVASKFKLTVMIYHELLFPSLWQTRLSVNQT